MGFRFRKTVKIFPGIRLNISKSGGSLSIGPRGASVNIGTKGVRATVGIPGTGISYTTSKADFDKDTKDEALNLLEKLTLSGDDKTFTDGCHALGAGNLDEALGKFGGLAGNPDAAFAAGIIAFLKGDLADAEKFLQGAEGGKASLNQHFAKVDLAPTFSLPITEELSAVIGCDEIGLVLALAEIYQATERWEDAITHLEQLAASDPDDVVVKLSLAELIMDHKGDDKAALQHVVELTGGTANETALHTALLLYKAKALIGLGLLDAAKEILGEALQRKKDRSAELLVAIRYERALIMEKQGQAEAARKEFEGIYAEVPGYEDVAKRLGLG